MGNTYTQIHIKSVFAVQNRNALIQPIWEEELYKYISGIVQNKGQKISIHTAKEALRDLLSAHKRQITIENIQKTVADYYRLKIADMHSKRRPANIAKPRQIAMYLSKEMTQKSLPEIGSAFGGRDHTTVLHAVKKINKERSSDEQLRHDLHILEQSLKG